MIQLLITAAGNTVDYTQYLLSSSVQIQEQINVPTQMTFSLIGWGGQFQVPPQRAYVQLFSTRWQKSIFSGFVSASPNRKFLDIFPVARFSQLGDRTVIPGGQLLQYDITCTSDEYLLNVKAVPFIPAFINRTQGAILTDIADVLCGPQLLTGKVNVYGSGVYLLSGDQFISSMAGNSVLINGISYLISRVNDISLPLPNLIITTSGGTQLNVGYQYTVRPSFFDYSHVASGDIVPFFQYDHTKSWAEIAKDFADGSRYRYKVRDKEIWYQPYGDQQLGIAYDENQPQNTFDTKRLNTSVLTVPTVNDITIIGDVEAGNNREDYFIGDGFTGNYQLQHKVFQGSSVTLVQESWNSFSLNQQQWYLFDQNINFDFSAGALNITTPQGGQYSLLGQDYLAMNNGLEVGGGIDLEVGEIVFVDYCQGILGGIYTDSDYTESSLVAGFELTSPAGVVLVPPPSSVTGAGSLGITSASGVVIQPWWAQPISRTGQVSTQNSPYGPVPVTFVSFQSGDQFDSTMNENPIVINGTTVTAHYISATQMTVTPQLGSLNNVTYTYAGPNEVGIPVVTQGNHNYVLQMLISAPKYTRYNQVFRTVDGEEFGGGSTAATGSITWNIQDYDIAAATGFFYTPNVTSYTLNNVSMPSFVTYAIANNLRLNVSITNTTVAKMPLGSLSALTGPSGLFTPTGLILPMLPLNSGWFNGVTGFIGSVQPWPSPASGSILPGPASLNATPSDLVLGNGFQLQAAQITPGNSADTLGFYAQSLPAAGTPVKLQSWESQAAVSRLQDEQSINEEALIVGDDGIRSAIVADLQPLPRTSEDCDNAAQAYLVDRVGTFYNGTYTCTSAGPACPLGGLQFFLPLTSDPQFWPTCGRFFNVNAPARGINKQKFLVTQLQMSVLDLSTELLQFQLQFGADLYLEKVLANFVDLNPPNVLTPKDAATPPNPRFTQDVNDSYLPDLNQVYVDQTTITNTSINVTVQDPYYGTIEVRRIDNNWGLGQTADLVGAFSWPGFQLQRQQLDQEWYMRAVKYGPGGIDSLALRNPGSGYHATDRIAIAQTGSNNGCVLNINNVNGAGGIIGYTRLSTGAGYVASLGNPTINLTSSGNGATFDITTITSSVPVGTSSSGTITSRRSKVLRVRYPVKPYPPSFISQTASVLQFDFDGDLRSIYGFELRGIGGSGLIAATGLLASSGLLAPTGAMILPATPASSLGAKLLALAQADWNSQLFGPVQEILVQKPIASYADLTIDVTQTRLAAIAEYFESFWLLFAYFFNQQWQYSDPTILLVPPILIGKVEFGILSDFSTATTMTLNTQVKTGFNFTQVIWNISADLGVAPAGQDAIFDIQLSKDQGTTWNSIFPTGNSNKIVISDGIALPATGQVAGFAIGSCSAGDWLKIVCIQAGSITPGSGIQGAIE